MSLHLIAKDLMKPIRPLLCVALSLPLMASICRQNPNAPTSSVNAVTVTANATTVDIGESVYLQCRQSGTLGSGLTDLESATWSSSDQSIVSLSGEAKHEGDAYLLGRGEAKSPGIADAKCTLVKNPGLSGSATITVRPYGVSVMPNPLALVAGGAAGTLNATFSTSNGTSVQFNSSLQTVSWTVDNDSPIVVLSPSTSPSVLVSGLAPGGTARVTARLIQGGKTFATGSGTVNVSLPPPAIVTTSGSQSVVKDFSIQIFVTFRDAAGNVITSPTLSFGAYDQTALQVLSQGPNFVVIKGLKVGQHKITITATKDGVSASTEITITVT
jgi:hypothetical protein